MGGLPSGVLLVNIREGVANYSFPAGFSGFITVAGEWLLEFIPRHCGGRDLIVVDEISSRVCVIDTNNEIS